MNKAKNIWEYWSVFLSCHTP